MPMKCKSKRCALESMHKGKCSPEGPYAVVNSVVNTQEAVVNRTQGEIGSNARGEVVGRLEQSPEVGKSVGRQTAWQQANREKYNERMRDYMRKKRKGFVGVPYG